VCFIDDDDNNVIDEIILLVKDPANNKDEGFLL